MKITSLDYHQALAMADCISKYQLEIGHLEQWAYEIDQQTVRDFNAVYEVGESRGSLTRGARQALRDNLEVSNLEMVPSQKIELERRFKERFGVEIRDLYPKWVIDGP